MGPNLQRQLDVQTIHSDVKLHARGHDRTTGDQQISIIRGQ